MTLYDLLPGNLPVAVGNRSSAPFFLIQTEQILSTASAAFGWFIAESMAG
jgi:hypothetical protein